VGEFVKLEVADGVGTIRLDRPKVNALNTQVTAEIGECAAEARDREDVGAVIVYGGEKVFAAGADIKEMKEQTTAEIFRYSGALQDAFSVLENLPQITIAAINGYCLGGGCELALACDFRICAEDSNLGQPEILLGVIPGGGGTQRLPRLVGSSRAKELIFSGRFVPAEEARAIGLVDEVVAPPEVYETSLQWAKRFAKGPRVALMAAKQTIRHGLETDLAGGMLMERHAFAALFATEDQQIGMDSFIENGPGKAGFVGR
jgi:enoyl-CoA hydratase/carnithine racemase